MRKKQNKIIGIIAITFCLLILFHTKAYAANIGMSISKSSAYVGDTFTVTISGINGKVNITGNSNITLDKTGSHFVEGSMTISGTTKSVGTGKITVTPVDVTTTAAEPEQITAAASRSITIKEKEVEKPKETTSTTTKQETTKTTTTKKNETKKEEVKQEEKKEVNFYISTMSLKGINENEEQIDITLSPEFNKDTYEYTCNVPADVNKIQIEKDAGEFNDFLTVTGLEEELKEGENVITIKLEKEGQETKTYTIKVIKEAKVVETVENLDENIQETKQEEKTIPMISMPVWQFILIQIAIIIAEVIVIKFVPWSKLLKTKSKSKRAK